MYRDLVNKIYQSHCCKFGGIADLRNYAPKIWWHSKYTKNGLRKFRGHSRFKKVRPRNSGAQQIDENVAPENFGGIADSRKYTPEIRGHSIGLPVFARKPLANNNEFVNITYIKT